MRLGKKCLIVKKEIPLCIITDSNIFSRVFYGLLVLKFNRRMSNLYQFEKYIKLKMITFFVLHMHKKTSSLIEANNILFII